MTPGRFQVRTKVGVAFVQYYVFDTVRQKPLTGMWPVYERLFCEDAVQMLNGNTMLKFMADDEVDRLLDQVIAKVKAS